MEQPASSSSQREVSPSIASRNNVSSSSSSSSSYSPATISPCPCLHSQIIRVREEDEHLAKALEMLPFRFPPSRMRDFCSSSLRPSRLGLRAGNQGVVQSVHLVLIVTYTWAGLFCLIAHARASAHSLPLLSLHEASRWFTAGAMCPPAVAATAPLLTPTISSCLHICRKRMSTSPSFYELCCSIFLPTA